MEQYRVKVKQLNKRTKPEVNTLNPDTISGQVEENSILYLSLAATLPNGEWYTDEKGGYYWGGGLEFIASSKLYPWWIKNSFYSIPDLWNSNQNDNVTIAILDTGLNNHIDFDKSKINGFNYLSNTKDFYQDPNGHGTHCSGIIAAQGKISYGVAPFVNLFIAKVIDDTGVPSLAAIKNALSDIYFNINGAVNIDIINMSFNIAPTSAEEKKIIDEISELLKKIVYKNKCLLVAACGDEDWDWNYFPASLEECISVGSIDPGFLRSSFSTKSLSLDIMAPGFEIISSSGHDSNISLSGTSQAAAFISAVCALALSEFKLKGNPNSLIIKRIMFQTAFSNYNSVKEYGHGIINPNKLIEIVKSL